jgi:hypothetical protein
MSNPLRLFVACLCVATALANAPRLAIAGDDTAPTANDEFPLSDPPADELASPTALFVWVDVERSSFVGQQVRLSIDFVNHLTTPYLVEEIDVSHVYMDGFDVVGVFAEPSEPVDPNGDTTTFTFNHTISPGDSWNVDIILKATRPGAFAGDVLVWSGDDYITTRAQTLVRQ